MTRRWVGYAESSHRGELVRALRSIDPQASIAFAHNAEELRSQVLGHNRGRLGVMVGFTGRGVSDVNLAAALARDGVAEEVVLVTRHASGSLKSRAMSAGISDVIDVSLLSEGCLDAGDPPDGLAFEGGEARDDLAGYGAIDEPDLSSECVPTTVAMPRVPSPRMVPSVPTADLGTRRGSAGPQARKGASVRRGPMEPASGQWHVVGGVGGPRDAGDDVPGSSGGLGRDETRAEPARGQRVREGARPGEGPVLTFVSGRGGVGKTALVAVAASIAAAWGMKVAVCDLDLSCGNLYSYLGLPHGADLAPLAGPGEHSLSEVQRIGLSAGDGMRLWGPCERPEMSEAVMPGVGALIARLSSAYDLVLVDTSSTFTDGVAQAAQACDRLLLVSDGGLGTTVALTRLGALAVRLGVARTRIVRLNNQCDPRGRDDVVLSRASVGLETAKSLRVVDGGDEVGELLAAGRAADVAQAVPLMGDSLASALAKILSEVGRLPSCEAALRAARDEGRRRRRLFGRRREAS